MKERLQFVAVIAIIVMLTFASLTVVAPYIPLVVAVKPVPTPFEILGYNIGDNGQFASWDKIVEYNLAVANASNRVKTYRFGWSEMGKPMIISVVTSPSNWAQMDTYKSILKALSDPRITPPDVAQDLSTKGIPVVWVQCNQHAGEIGSSEMSMELLYKLASSNEKSVTDILDNVIVIIDPSINPDGHDMWVDWHYQWAGTPWNDTSPPYVGKYIGHDDNRDWFTANMKENQYNEKAIQEWMPQVFEDHHESGPARIFTPPNPDPLHPEIPPIVRAGWIMYGGFIQQQAATKNLPGYVSGVSYDMWYPGYGDTWPAYHGAYGMTFETDSGHWDTFKTPKSLEKQGVLWNQPIPWTGGWWTLRDNINYQEGATWSDIELTARFKEKILWSYYQIFYQAVQKGKTVPPYAFVVPPGQKDPGAMAKMLNRLITQGVNVNAATASIDNVMACSINQNQCSSMSFPVGSYVVRMDQPLRGYAKTLLEYQNYLSTYPRPYDVTAWTIPMMMGVQTFNVTDPAVLNVPMSLVPKVEPPPGGVMGPASYAYAFSHDMNNAIIAMNRLLKAGYQIYLAKDSFTDGSTTFAAGTIIVPLATGLDQEIAQIAQDLYIKVYPIAKPSIDVYSVTKPNIGLFYGYTSTMDEGWTRWLLEQFEFEYTRLDVDAIQGSLSQFDVILLPRMSRSAIVNGPSFYPPAYAKGIGATGVANLKAFVEAGGTLVCEDSSCSLPIQDFAGIGVSLVPGTSAIIAPGSILHVTNIANTTQIGYGYPTGDGAAFWQSSYAYTVTGGTVLATYDSVNPFLSGILTDTGHILNGKAAAAVTPYGNQGGNIVLFAFRVLNRGQPDNTFQLYFNSIYFSTETLTSLPP